MKKSSILVLLVLILVSCQNQNKIGFIDNGKMINEYQEKKDIEEKFTKKEQAFQLKTDSIGKAFQLEAQDFQLKLASLSQSKQQEQYQVLGQKQKMLQQQIQYEQQQMQQAYQTEIDSVITKVKSFVKDYGKDNGYTYILGTSDNAASVLYGAEEHDLTQEMIDALNANYTKNK
ncbi:periplasmic chaperone for outer membrane proteins Skp [Flavobacteriaceae bacterium MAR_2010_72]|nr:periplasmic chaperone for outer membrane proteins Skp [Flavobacteriaceae bacterium MAR_2010_72]TVZ58297.1 periplasmic chaperone for outer membrane proteins Skp [Flavobacteriaceae bacterium MAR_2010_105]